MATRVDYVNSIKNADMDTIYLTGAGYVNYPFKGVSRDSALGWDEPVWGSELNRGLDLVMDNIDTVDYGMVARCEISFKYMNVQDYKVLCKISKQRVCYANFFNRETGQRVTQEMAFTGNEISKLYKFGTQYLGVLDISIKLVATNRDRADEISASHTISYNANGGTGSIDSETVKWAGQKTLASSGMTKSGSTLLGWNTQANGYGEDYTLGQSLTVFGNISLYAQWGDIATLKDGASINKLIKESNSTTVVDNEVERIIFDNFTGEDEYTSYGANQLKNTRFLGYGDNENKVKVFKSNDNKQVFVLCAKNCSIYANQDCNSTFSFFDKLIDIRFNNFNTINATTMSGMFEYCSSLKEIDLSSFNLSNLTNNGVNLNGINYMFLACASLMEIDLSSLNAPNITEMYGTFEDCESLKTISLPYLKYGKIKSLERTFRRCKSLTTIYGLDNITLDSNNISSFSMMFQSCTNISSIDLTTFELNNDNIDVSYMFYNCGGKLSTIYVTEGLWDSSRLRESNNTFMYSYYLMGSTGTTYKNANTGSQFARIDSEGNPGYLTKINQPISRGVFVDWDDVPQDSSMYNKDLYGDSVPKQNDMIIIRRLSRYMVNGYPGTFENSTNNYQLTASCGEGITSLSGFPVNEIDYWDKNSETSYSITYGGIYFTLTYNSTNDKWIFAWYDGPNLLGEEYLDRSSYEYISSMWAFIYEGVWDSNGKNGWKPMKKIVR